MTTAAREVFGTDERRVENPWLIGKDDLIQRLKCSVTRRNEISEIERREGQDLEREMNEAREQLKEARNDMKRHLRGWKENGGKRK